VEDWGEEESSTKGVNDRQEEGCPPPSPTVSRGGQTWRRFKNGGRKVVTLTRPNKTSVLQAKQYLSFPLIATSHQ